MIQDIEIRCAFCGKVLAKFRAYKQDYSETSYICEFCYIKKNMLYRNNPDTLKVLSPYQSFKQMKGGKINGEI